MRRTLRAYGDWLRKELGGGAHGAFARYRRARQSLRTSISARNHRVYKTNMKMAPMRSHFHETGLETCLRSAGAVPFFLRHGHAVPGRALGMGDAIAAPAPFRFLDDDARTAMFLDDCGTAVFLDPHAGRSDAYVLRQANRVGAGGSSQHRRGGDQSSNSRHGEHRGSHWVFLSALV